MAKNTDPNITNAMAKTLIRIYNQRHGQNTDPNSQSYKASSSSSIHFFPVFLFFSQVFSISFFLFFFNRFSFFKMKEELTHISPPKSCKQEVAVWHLQNNIESLF